MARVLITGMSGAGKTTLLDELARRGHRTVDTDYGGWVRANSMWDERRMDELLAQHPDLIVSGTAENQGRFYDRFDHVILLSAPLHVLIERVRTRDNNPYGRSSREQDEISRYVQTVEPLLRRTATLELSAAQPLQELADTVERLVEGASASRSDEDQPD